MVVPAKLTINGDSLVLSFISFLQLLLMYEVCAADGLAFVSDGNYFTFVRIEAH